MVGVEKWKSYWADQSTPLQRHNTPEFYRLYAKELQVLFGDRQPGRVLEIGCGDGAMFELLGFAHIKYRGVDFSPRLLASFRSKYPNVELECCEGSSYVNGDNKYDLIFSNQVVQYFDSPMLKKHFACARSMMHKDSLLVCASIPWRLHRTGFDSGRLAETMVPSIRKLVKAKIARLLFGDSMGHWYDPTEINALAKMHGFSAEFYGTMLHFYRFHAVLRPE